MRLQPGTNIVSYPSPTGGWNARDSVADMKPDQAVFLDNWFPGFGQVTLRKGYIEHATGMVGHVQMLATFDNGATSKLLAAANGNIWDITSSGAASSLGSGFNNDKWYYGQMDDKTAFVNGQDTPQKYDGTTLSALSITGPTATDLIGIHVHKERSYFWPVNSSSLWYSANKALGGTLTEFNLKTVVSKGGSIMAVGTWSRDAGDGMDDFLVIVMSTGQVVVYQGLSPADSAWSRVGVYQTGEPIARQAVINIGGDLIIMTYDGFIPMTAVMSKGEFAKDSTINDRIRGAVQDAANLYGTNYGWKGVYYPNGSMGIFNIPLVENSQTQQFVVNTSTGAWCRFKDIQANDWIVFNKQLYFASSGGKVYKADTGFNDNGSDIQGDAMPAFSYMKTKQIKIFTGLYIILSSEGAVPVEARIATDFATPTVSVASSTFPATGTAWDDGVWDAFDWAGTDEVIKIWKMTKGKGHTGSVRFRVKTANQRVKWMSTSYLFKKGGIL